MITQSQISQIQFKGRISVVKNLIDALKALNIEKSKVTEANVIINETGFEIIVEDSNCFQATVSTHSKIRFCPDAMLISFYI